MTVFPLSVMPTLFQGTRRKQNFDETPDLSSAVSLVQKCRRAKKSLEIPSNTNVGQLDPKMEIFMTTPEELVFLKKHKSQVVEVVYQAEAKGKSLFPEMLRRSIEKSVNEITEVK